MSPRCVRKQAHRAVLEIESRSYYSLCLHSTVTPACIQFSSALRGSDRYLLFNENTCVGDRESTAKGGEKVWGLQVISGKNLLGEFLSRGSSRMLIDVCNLTS